MQFLRMLTCSCKCPSAPKETAQVSPLPNNTVIGQKLFESKATSTDPPIVEVKVADENKENGTITVERPQEIPATQVNGVSVKVDDEKPKPAGGGCCITKSGGILYATPSDACKAPPEKYLFVTCPSVAQPRRPDALMTVDVDPGSKTYCKVICKLEFPHIGDEIHHTGWNACASCYGNLQIKRTHLILPCLHSSRVYIVNTQNPKKLQLTHTVEAEEFKPLNTTFLHTTHCLPDGIMISTLGDNDGNNSGEFVLLDSKTFKVKGKWNVEGSKTTFNYDYWYQPRKNVMLSTEWGTPNKIMTGFNPGHVGEGHYGNKVYVWNWTTHERIQTIELEGPAGWIPLEVRFYHEPTQPHAFVGTALGSAVYHIYQENDDEPYQQRLAAIVPSHKVEGWVLPVMPPLITDIIMSMDDRFLYVSCWLHGEILQYNVVDPFDFKLVGKVTIGGLLHKQSGIKVLDENFVEYNRTTVKGREVHGGPQMMQLSLDGRRLYVTTSLYTVWDQQFYPEMMEKGSVMLRIDVNTSEGGMSLNPDFMIDFGILEDGPYAAHEMRYPGGDCTSDIWL